MGEVVNLRLRRKQAARAAREAEAAENRARFGRPKAESRSTRLGMERDARVLDGHRLERGSGADSET